MSDDPTRHPTHAAIAIAVTVAMLTSGCVGVLPASGDANTTTDGDADPDFPDENKSYVPPTSEETGSNTTDTNSTDTNSTDTNSTDTNEAGTDDPDPAPGPRTVEHAMGETTIEGRTTRIVALEWNHVEGVLGLGIQPVGVANIEGYENWVGVGNLSESVTDVGTRSEPSIEKITELEPDLILAVEFRHENIYDDLSDIAPTLVFELYPEAATEPENAGRNAELDHYQRMWDIFNRTAKAAAMEDRGETVYRSANENLTKDRKTLEAAGKTGREVLIAQLFTTDGQPLARTMVDGSIADRIVEALGLENAWTKTACDYGYGFCDHSKEAYSDVQHADYFYQAQDDDDPARDQWKDDPVWNSYEFVQEDRVYDLGPDAWLFAGPLAVQLIGDRIVHHYTS